MAITASFTVSQTVGLPSNINLLDTSSGSDISAVARRIYITNDAGAYLVPTGTTTNYVLFPLASGASISINVLTKDMALSITLQYVDINGNVVATTAAILEGFTLYNESFYYTLTQAQAQQNQPPPNIIQDSNYYGNKMILRVEIDSGNQAISLASDITTAQGCYDRATYMRLNEGNYF